MEVTSSGSKLPQPGSPQADSMVLLELFVIFVYKKEKKTVPNDLNECIFVYVHGQRSETEVWAGTGHLVWWPSVSVSFVLFLSIFFLILTFLLSLLHHKYFLLTFIEDTL